MARHSMRVLAVVALVVGSLIGAGVTLTAVGPATPNAQADGPQQPGTDRDGTVSGAPAVQTFEDEAAFRSYVRDGSQLADGAAGFQRQPVAMTDTTIDLEASGRPESVARSTVRADAAAPADDGGGTEPSRIANTNVQTAGLDEPDIVKTDGSQFYYAPGDRRPVYISRPRVTIPEQPVEPRRSVSDDVARYRPEPRTHVIDASDPNAPEAVSAINTTGKLLQTGDTLVVFERNRVAGYDVSDPAEPTEEWSKPLNGSLVTAREQGGTVYLVTESPARASSPCPIRPLGPDHVVPCDGIYRPDTQVPVDATYSAFSIDADQGSVGDSVSFVGTSRNSVVYMSPEALYVTYTERTDRGQLIGEFLTEEFDRTPTHLRDRITEIQSYDISPDSKEREIRRAFDRWVQSLPADRRQSVREAYDEGLSAYIADNQRRLTRTGIVRVDVAGDDLSVDATGTVPGTPLDQFSMDQHDGTLRITTTIPGTDQADSENDLYVLDSQSLEERGSVTGMGVTERVYSVRYVDDTAYVVTFRRIDPFHVVDLSDPADPEEVGKLELPGFSSYLHPVDDDHVLGIGEEDGEVKTVLFDVSDPSDPTIADSKLLDRGWSAVSETHHAFLMDRKHGVFVLPAGQESVVMDYTDESLSVETTIETDERATRARYVDDYLYIFAGDSITVVDETSWDEVLTLSLNG